MSIQLLTENGWKATGLKLKIKDNGLQRTLAAYEKLDDDEYEDRLKEIANMGRLAAALKKDKEVAALPAVVKYLADLMGAAESEQREITKAKLLAQKTEAMTQRNTDAAAKNRGQEKDEEEEEEEGDYHLKLATAFQKLKSAKDLSYEFIVCDAKPHCAIMVAKRITSKHKEVLSKVTGGSKRFLHLGTCHSENGKFTFTMEEPVTGLARKLQDSIKHFTGKKFPIVVGTESAEADEEPLLNAINPDARPSADPSEAQDPPLNVTRPFEISAPVGRGGKNKPEDVQAVQAALNRRAKAGLTVDGKCNPETIKAIEAFQKNLGRFKPDGLVEPGRGTARALASSAKLGPPPEPPRPMAPPKLGKATLAKAPEVWHGTRQIVKTNIEELKKGVRAEFGTEHPEVLKAIDENMKKLDVVIDKLDHRLADSLAKANAAGNDAARKAELKNSKTILAEYINYVKSEPLIANIDCNPFGVDTNLKKVLIESLTHMAQAIG